MFVQILWIENNDRCMCSRLQMENNDGYAYSRLLISDCTDKEQMMALLSELKILIHLGQHLNIVNLLGAVTKDIRFGELVFPWLLVGGFVQVLETWTVLEVLNLDKVPEFKTKASKNMCV